MRVLHSLWERLHLDENEELTLQEYIEIDQDLSTSEFSNEIA